MQICVLLTHQSPGWRAGRSPGCSPIGPPRCLGLWPDLKWLDQRNSLKTDKNILWQTEQSNTSKYMHWRSENNWQICTKIWEKLAKLQYMTGGEWCSIVLQLVIAFLFNLSNTFSITCYVCKISEKMSNCLLWMT